MNLPRILSFRALVVACALALGAAGAAHACTNPTGVEGQNRFDSASKRMVFCNGTSWVAAGGPTEAISNTNSGIVATSGGTISLTLGGTAGAAYIHPTAGFVGPSVSATTAPLKSFTPVSGNDVATKDYVDSTVAGASGGASVIRCSLTANTYNGNLGGISGANSICVSEFGTGYSVWQSRTQYYGFPLAVTRTSSNGMQQNWDVGRSSGNCNNWTSSSDSYTGYYFYGISIDAQGNITSPSGGANVGCSNPYVILCCTAP